MTARTTPSNPGLMARWHAFSDRERTLLSATLALVFVIGAVYLALLPGLSAARSSESRRSLAAQELAEVRALAQQVTSIEAKAGATSMDHALTAAANLALEYGVQIVDQVAEDGQIRMRVQATDSAGILGWAAHAASDMTMGVASLQMERAGAGVSASLVFHRGTS